MAAVDWVASDKITSTKLLAMEVGHLITPSVATTVANTVTETEFAEFLIPANTAETGMCWRMKAWGAWNGVATNTFNARLRVGANTTASSNTQQAQTGTQTINNTVTVRGWLAFVDIVCESTGATGAVNGPFHLKTAGIASNTGAPWLNDTTELTTAIDGTSSTTIDTTVDNYVSLTIVWSAASASNSWLCRGFTSEKLVP